MAVRWPDGSYTGSVQVDTAQAPVEPEPGTTEEDEPVEVKSDYYKKEASDGTR